MPQCTQQLPKKMSTTLEESPSFDSLYKFKVPTCKSHGVSRRESEERPFNEGLLCGIASCERLVGF